MIYFNVATGRKRYMLNFQLIGGSFVSKDRLPVVIKYLSSETSYISFDVHKFASSQVTSVNIYTRMVGNLFSWVVLSVLNVKTKAQNCMQSMRPERDQRLLSCSFSGTLSE